MSDDIQPAEPVLLELLTPNIALVTLNRPEKRNAVNPALALAMESIVRKIEESTEIRVAILASSQPRVFCAGADLGAIAAGQARDLETPLNGFGGFVFATRLKPWIAVVEGLAVGGGFEICLACDMIVASNEARFSLPEVKRGLMAGAGGVHRLAGALPRNIANELLATGEAFDAELAHRYGLVNRLLPAGEALAAARDIAETIAANAPLAVQHTLAAARESQGQADGAARAFAATHVAALRRTEDFREGPRAFMEKREPVWSGR